ncbi:MAG: HIT domain-containing protein [Candidatus Paceibacterota bacterium]|jgi:histidine triad (HIT) family protein
MEKRCPFCDILETKKRIIKEGKSIFVILSDPRLMVGHILVIPKRHVEKISELEEEERRELFNFTVKFQEKILEKIAPGCDIRQHHRPFISQNDLKIDHLHIHLQPRFLDDELYKKSQIYHRNIFKPLTEKEANKISKLLK